MIITEVEGDLFDAPDGAVLIHACNCLGSWGGGIAKAFQAKYPAAYEIYKEHCRDLRQSSRSQTLIHPDTGEEQDVRFPLGTALIIPPQKEDYESDTPAKKHWIVCLFTSYAYGRSVSPPHIVLANSVHALRDMKRQLEEIHRQGKAEWDGKLHTCRFNSGLFRVRWEDSKAVLEKELDETEGVQEIVVVRPRGG
ncbi:putative phosphatase [Talaromyces proteolyticus]|uniref:ADP-ribose 1''-phosphate phosphatase n=1 Tax=Talaromyces proteolyticus TaxID=1131652 RepID=A0AAD4KNY1_9EURO|nr:putative phosphatase [Talaromyces proteolyticus]KAH8692240.1 putative phosphatase [Talaromyces proteolyticus]